MKILKKKCNTKFSNSHATVSDCVKTTGRTISTLGRGSSMIVRIGEPKRVGGRG